MRHETNGKTQDNEFLEMCRSTLEVGKTYKYKELCVALGEDTKKSNAKKSQLKRWKRFFRWENPTTHTYKITEKLQVPAERKDGRANNGGARRNSGAKPKTQEEFDYLLNAFLHREFNRNAYNGQSHLCQAYFSGSEINRFFGLCSDDFYNAREDFSMIVNEATKDIGRASIKISEFNNAWSDVSRKLAEKRRTWIYNKISATDGVTLENGIIAYKDKGDREFEYKDEYLDRWNAYMNEYVKSKKLRTIADVADNGLWLDMLESISDNFNGYETVERAKKVTFDVSVLREYEWSDYNRHRLSLNSKLVDELSAFLSKRVDEEALPMYRYVIDRYVKIRDA